MVCLTVAATCNMLAKEGLPHLTVTQNVSKLESILNSVILALPSPAQPHPALPSPAQPRSLYTLDRFNA
jgi:hypothetical protein